MNGDHRHPHSILEKQGDESLRLALDVLGRAPPLCCPMADVS